MIDDKLYQKFKAWWETNKIGFTGLKAFPANDADLFNHKDFLEWAKQEVNLLPDFNSKLGVYSLQDYWRKSQDEINEQYAQDEGRRLAKLLKYHSLVRTNGITNPDSLPKYDTFRKGWFDEWKTKLQSEGQNIGNVTMIGKEAFDTVKGTPIPTEVANLEISKYLRSIQEPTGEETPKERKDRFEKQSERAEALWAKQATLAEEKRQFDAQNWKVQPPQLSYEQEGEMRAGLFENARQGGIKGASNWIDRWMAQHQPNPYLQAASTRYNRGWDVQQAREQYQNIQGSPEGWEPTNYPAYNPPISSTWHPAQPEDANAYNPPGYNKNRNEGRTSYSEETPSVLAIKLAMKALDADKRLASAQTGYAPPMVSAPGSGRAVIPSQRPDRWSDIPAGTPLASGGGMTPSYAGMEREPPEPEVPDWAGGLIPGKTIPWFGNRVTTVGARDLPIPNPHTFASLTPTQQEMYAGYLDWNAQNPTEDTRTKLGYQRPPRLEDIQNQWKLTYGALRNPSGESWRVRRQR